MDSTRRIPLWAWWVIGIAVIVAVSAGAVFLVRQSRPALPPGLVELRESVAKILEESSRLEDVDVKPLIELEAKQDYAGAVALLDRALAANAAHETVAASLVGVSENLTKLAIQVKPDAVATKAIEAFGLLAQLARAEQKFYEDRRQLYEMTKQYYAGLADGKNPPIPPGLQPLVDAVNDDLARARGLRERFAAGVQAFDEAVAGR